MNPRPLADAELRLLLYLLQDDPTFPEADVFRRQIPFLTVTSRCSCGCPTVDFAADGARAPRATSRGYNPLSVEARADVDGSPVEVMLFERDGWLQSLELVSYSDDAPAAFPDIASLSRVIPT